MSRFQQAETDTFFVTALDSDGVGVTGSSATIKFVVYRKDTAQYWTGAAWGAYTELASTETDATNLPGTYQYTLSAYPSADTTIVIRAKTTNSSIDNFPREESVTVGGYADDVDAPISTVDTNVDTLITRVPDTISLANINTQCDTAFTDYDPPTRAELTSDKDAIIVEVNANETKIDLVDTNVDTLVTRVPDTISLANINTQCDTALTDYDPPTKAELDAGLAALNDVSTAEVNAACDTALADYDAVIPADLPANFADLSITATTGRVSVGTMAVSALADFFNTDSGESYATSIDGSVVKEVADNAGGGAGGVKDWTDAEREQIRDALGIDGTKSDAEDGQLQDIPDDVEENLIAMGLRNLHEEVRRLALQQEAILRILKARV